MQKITDHAKKRKSQRGVSDEMIRLTLDYGKMFFRQGYNFYVLIKKLLPKSISSKLRDKSEGTVVVCKDEKIITTYKNRNALSKIKRKPKTKK